jgi:hypothetical protein
MTAVYLVAAGVALLAVTWAVVARILRDADPLDADPDAFRRAMADPNRDHHRDDLGGHQ